jgi:prevent-host-death family protein
METLNILAAKTHFSALVERAEKGETIIIARAGKPVARLVPLEPEVALDRVAMAKRRMASSKAR